MDLGVVFHSYSHFQDHLYNDLPVAKPLHLMYNYSLNLTVSLSLEGCIITQYASRVNGTLALDK